MKVKDSTGTLYIVATPIGNLGDITLRALDVLKKVDFIAAEDTRHTIKLLNHYEIKTKMISHHEHNEDESAKGIVLLLDKGKDVALVTDAGMPCISDPGYKLVSLAREEGHNVTCLPGASALPAAIALSGLDAGRFRFEGFLPKNKSKRILLLEEIAKDGCAFVIYEAPHRLEKTAGEIAEIFDERKIAVIKDVSKTYEKAAVYKASEIKASLSDWNIKGEFVIVVEKGSKRNSEEFESLSVKKHVKSIMTKENINKMEAIKKVAKIRKVQKNEIYKEMIDE